MEVKHACKQTEVGDDIAEIEARIKLLQPGARRANVALFAQVTRAVPQ